MTKTKQTLLVSATILSVILFFAQFTQQELVFYRDKIETGQWWRIFSGNLTHSNFSHLGINLLSLLLLVFLFYDTLKAKTFIFSTIILSCLVGLGLYFFNPELQKYYGFSGVLYGLFIVAAIRAILEKDYFVAPLVLLFVLAKVIWEFFKGGSQTSADLIGIPVATDSHLYGVLGAIFIGIIVVLHHFLSKKTPKRHPPTF